MILPKSNRLTPEQLAEITEIVGEFGCAIQPIIGAVRTIYAIVGDERDDLMINRLEGLPFVERIDRIQSPFKLLDRRSDLANNKIAIGGVTLGEELLVIAGQCTIDPKNPNYFLETAAAVKEAGAHVIRGGVWKPRTNPYTFQGDSKSIEVLMEASRATGLPVNAEVMDEQQVGVVAVRMGEHDQPPVPGVAELVEPAGVDPGLLGPRHQAPVDLLAQVFVDPGCHRAVERRVGSVAPLALGVRQRRVQVAGQQHAGRGGPQTGWSRQERG